MCQHCEDWRRDADALVWRGINQRNKVRALKEQIGPLLTGPLHMQFEALFGGVLESLAGMETQAAENQRLAHSCPSSLSLAESMKNTERRQDILRGGGSVVDRLDEIIAMARQFLAQNMAGFSNPGEVLHRAASSYLNMMNGVLDEWRAQSILTNEKWDALWSDIKQRQDMLDAKKLAVMSGATVIDLFPWN